MGIYIYNTRRSHDQEASALDFLGGFDGDGVFSELTEYRIDRLRTR